MIRKIECWIVGLDALGRHALFVPHLGHFFLRPLFDDDVLALLDTHIDGGGGPEHIERNAVVLRQDGHTGGADLVARVAVGSYPVTADKHCVDPSVFHHLGSHIVTDDRGIHAVGIQFEGREARALQQRPGLVAEHSEVHALFPSEVDRRQSRAVLRRGQLAGIAMGQDAVPILDQRQAVFADHPAHPDILRLDLDALLPQQFHDLRNRFFLVIDDHLLHPVQRPGKVHRRRAGGVQVFLRFVEGIEEFLICIRLNVLRRQVNAEGRRDADRRSAPDLKQIDCLPDIFLVGQMQDLHLTRQLCLVQDHQRTFLLIQRNGFISHNALVAHCLFSFSVRLFRPRGAPPQRNPHPYGSLPRS